MSQIHRNCGWAKKPLIFEIIRVLRGGGKEIHFGSWISIFYMKKKQKTYHRSWFWPWCVVCMWCWQVTGGGSCTSFLKLTLHFFETSFWKFMNQLSERNRKKVEITCFFHQFHDILVRHFADCWKIFRCSRNLIWEHVLNLFFTLIKEILHFKNVKKKPISFFDSISIHKNVHKNDECLADKINVGVCSAKFGEKEIVVKRVPSQLFTPEEVHSFAFFFHALLFLFSA